MIANANCGLAERTTDWLVCWKLAWQVGLAHWGKREFSLAKEDVLFSSFCSLVFIDRQLCLGEERAARWAWNTALMTGTHFNSHPDWPVVWRLTKQLLARTLFSKHASNSVLPSAAQRTASFEFSAPVIQIAYKHLEVFNLVVVSALKSRPFWWQISSQLSATKLPCGDSITLQYSLNDFS